MTTEARKHAEKADRPRETRSARFRRLYTKDLTDDEKVTLLTQYHRGGCTVTHPGDLTNPQQGDNK